MADFAKFVRTKGLQPGDPVLLYCWRGGLRSSSMCWLLQLCGYDCATLNDGYRSFRTWVQELMRSPGAPVEQSPAHDEEGPPAEFGEAWSAVRDEVAMALRGFSRASTFRALASSLTEIAISEAEISRIVDEGYEGDVMGSSAEEQETGFAVHFARARTSQAHSRWDAAVVEYLRALRSGHPQQVHCLMMASTCLRQVGRHAEALGCLNASAERVASEVMGVKAQVDARPTGGRWVRRSKLIP